MFYSWLSACGYFFFRLRGNILIASANVSPVWCVTLPFLTPVVYDFLPKAPQTLLGISFQTPFSNFLEQKKRQLLRNKNYYKLNAFLRKHINKKEQEVYKL